MIFFIVGAPIVFIIGLSIGITFTMLFLILFLSFANNIPLTQPMHVFVEMFLQMNKFWYRLTQKKFRITQEMVNKSIDEFELNNCTKYPFVRILPMTKPCKEAQFWDNMLFKEKQKNFVAELAKPYKSSRITKLRDQLTFSEPMFTMLDENTTVNVELINNVTCHWIEYTGSSLENGLILCAHGGGYVAGMPSMQYNLCSYLSKLTGCVCLSVDYKLCPEQLIPDCVNDVFNVYKYLIENKMVSSSKKICIMGESAGGGLSLLLLQKIRDLDDIDNPGCCWVNSPWTDLSMESESAKKNAKNDAMLVNDPHKYFQRMSVGEIDKNAKQIDLKKQKYGFQIKQQELFDNEGQKSDSSLMKNKLFSPLYGEWNDLCPIYFMVGATEMLVNDTLNAAKKAFDCGVTVKCDIEPFMHHTWPLFLRTLPEATYSVVRAADFIMDHLALA